MKTIINYWKQAILCACTMVSTVSTFSQSEGWVGYESEQMISQILTDGENLWIAANFGLLQLNTKTEAATVHELGLSDFPRLRNLIKDSDGNLWITTQRDGVIKYDSQNPPVHYNTSNSGLATNQYCSSIAIDANNDKWIGSLAYLNKFDGNTWQAWSTPLSQVAAYWFIRDLKFDRYGDLWMGGDSPEWRFAKFTGEEIQPIPEVTKAVSGILIDEDNNKWLASLQGLIKYDGTKFVTWNTENSNLPANDVYDIKQDASGNIWLACNKYLVRFDGRELTVYPSPLVEENNIMNFITCLEFDDAGNIWFGTKLSGLFKFTPTPESFLRVLNSPTAIKTISGREVDNEFSVRSTDSKLSVDFRLTGAARVSLSVLDLQGREVVSFVKQSRLPAGAYNYFLALTKGIYLVKYSVEGDAFVKKIIVQ
jgi:ligand-binding sensor domain-containing protein